MSSLYCLIPTPNCRTDVDWVAEGPRLRQKVAEQLGHRHLGHKDQIIGEKIISPDDWQADNIHLGATFSMYNLGQMLHRRPFLGSTDSNRPGWSGGDTPRIGSSHFLASQTTARLLCKGRSRLCSGSSSNSWWFSSIRG